MKDKVDYGFGGRLTETFPSQIIVDLTERCNLACKHCPHSSTFKDSRQYSELDVSLHKKLVTEIGTEGKGIIQHLRYTANGEPFLHSHFMELIKDAVLNSGTFVSITTNGHFLDEDKCEELLNIGVGLIDISIDAASQEVYEAIRINGSYSRVLENVHRLIHMRDSKTAMTKIAVSFVNQPLNEHETEMFENYWMQQGVDRVIVRRLHSAGGAFEQESEALLRKPCVYPWERITLTAHGMLSFCPTAWLPGSEFENFKNVTIREVWQGKFYKNLREAHINNNYTEFDYCKRCPDWRTIRWPNEDISYGDMILNFDKEVSSKK